MLLNIQALSHIRRLGELCLLLGLMTVALPLSAAVTVATVTEIDGRVYASQPDAALRRLSAGDGVSRMDRIATTRGASITLTFTDKTEMILGESSSIRIDEYDFDENDESESASVGFATSILGGVVRTLTGFIAKRSPRSVLYRTAVATIGVRGTHFTVEVQGTSATVILLAQADAQSANAIDVANQFGKVEIEQAGFGTEIPDASSPPSPPRRMQVSNNMSRILRSVNTTRRVRIPRPPR